MLKILTKKEVSFLMELAAILKKYDAMIAAKDGKIEISVFDGDYLLNGEVKYPIYFSSEFDDNDIFELVCDTGVLIDTCSEIKEFINEIPKIKKLLVQKHPVEEEEE